MDKPANFKMFRLVEIDEFDARRGYRRCDPPGIGVHMGGDGPNPEAEADFWRDRAGGLVVRFSSQGYRLHFTAKLTDGGPVPESAMRDFCDFVGDTLFQWVIEGVDDLPNSIYDAECAD